MSKRIELIKEIKCKYGISLKEAVQVADCGHPTMHLRIKNTERRSSLPGYPDVYQKAEVLQQKWVHEDGREEWRDVPRAGGDA